MTKKQREFLFYPEDIQESMMRIQNYISGLTFEDFEKNHLVIDAVVRNLEVIGEASKNVPARIQKKYSQLPWKQMYSLRNLVI